MILAIACFLMAAFADVLWAKYTIYAAEKKAFAAALWGALIIPAGAISVIAYTENHWYLIASTAGAFVGTYGAVKRHKDTVADTAQV